MAESDRIQTGIYGLDAIFLGGMVGAVTGGGVSCAATAKGSASAPPTMKAAMQRVAD